MHKLFWFVDKKVIYNYNSCSSTSHYEVLDVAKNASQDEIKKSFFEKSKQVQQANLLWYIMYY